MYKDPDFPLGSRWTMHTKGAPSLDMIVVRVTKRTVKMEATDLSFSMTFYDKPRVLASKNMVRWFP